MTTYVLAAIHLPSITVVFRISPSESVKIGQRREVHAIFFRRQRRIKTILIFNIERPRPYRSAHCAATHKNVHHPKYLMQQCEQQSTSNSLPEAALLSLNSRFRTSIGKALGDLGLKVSRISRVHRSHLHHHAGGDFRLYLNPVSVCIFGMIDAQDGERGSHCIPQTVLCKPTT